MRLGVADVGSNTVRLVITEQDGGLPLPVHTSKRRPHLAERVPADGRLATEHRNSLPRYRLAPGA
ncbi:hypothetical protein ACFUAC_05475 [Streptomyces sp. NPDC057148]|uniref:hypothetical protein n=1 Tax=unclassified Streptomyces TaxID=2593676 RepID=UPI0036338EBE